MKLKTYIISVFAGLGGIIFGYDTGIISGALLFIKQEYSLSPFMQGLIVSQVLIGAMIGAWGAGHAADRYGRKRSILVASCVFILGSLLMAWSPNIDVLLAGRLINGLAIGILSMSVPLYISEIVPKEIRGACVSLNQLAITIGIVVAYLVSYSLASSGNWRLMFALAVVPAAIQFLGMLFLPESPSVSYQDSASWKHLMKPALKPALLIGIGLAMFQQITGINTVIYFAPSIFKMSGFESSAVAILATLGIGVINVFFTVVSLFLIDRWGRKPLLYVGLVGECISLTTLGLAFLSPEHAAWIAVVSVGVYVASFAISLGPIAWLVIAEIYPVEVRSSAMSLATVANWFFNFVVSLTFLSLVHGLGASYTFWIYAVMCVLGIIFVYRLVPETKGKSLEEIGVRWK